MQRPVMSLERIKEYPCLLANSSIRFLTEGLATVQETKKKDYNNKYTMIWNRDF